MVEWKKAIRPLKEKSRDVKIGGHIAPSFKDVYSLMSEFEHLYDKSLKEADAIKLIYILTSHHRLMWIYSFLDKRYLAIILYTVYKTSLSLCEKHR